jgi:hypothetical protein
MSVLSRGTLNDAPAIPSAIAATGSSGIRWLVTALVPLALLYLALLNPYWVPSGDGEVYTCIARSLVKGEGLMFNGSRAAIAPPGWPLVLSWAMRISPEFWFLKLLVTTFLLASFIPAFYVVRRFLSDRASAGVICLTGTLSTVYPLAFWMHTEAFFCVLGFSAILIAYRIREGRAKVRIEVPLMLLLLALGAFTRWPGVLHAALIVPILLSGRPALWKDRRTLVLCLLTVVTCYATYKITYSYLSLSPHEQALAAMSGGMSDAETGDIDSDATTEPTTGPTTSQMLHAGDDDETPDTNTFRNIKRTFIGEITYRVGTAGKWFSWLLWQPSRFGQSVHFINVSALIAGWTAIALLGIALYAEWRRRDYFWIGLALYTGGLCVLWPNPNARYFVPVAPFIITGIFIGIREASNWLASRPRGARFARPVGVGVAGLFVLGTVGSNLPLLAIEIGVFRSKHFYAKYEAGQSKELIAVADYILKHPRDGTIVINELYDNMGRQRYSKFGMRALHLLTNQPIIGLERKSRLKTRPTGGDDAVRKWLKNRANASYLVYQAAWNPWRVWHFRLSPELQKKLTGRTVSFETGGWELFARENAKYPKVDGIPSASGPTRVPGL